VCIGLYTFTGILSSKLLAISMRCSARCDGDAIAYGVAIAPGTATHARPIASEKVYKNKGLCVNLVKFGHVTLTIPLLGSVELMNRLCITVPS